jgi:hypothetical protein
MKGLLSRAIVLDGYVNVESGLRGRVANGVIDHGSPGFLLANGL